MKQFENDQIRTTVRRQYREIATSENISCACNPSSCCDTGSVDAKIISQVLGYTAQDVNQVPVSSNMGLGCGNPTAIASLKKGEKVLDLGSGGGFDCFLAAAQVGTDGYVIGVDMTPEMVSKARKNAFEAQLDYVDFRLGEIENLPLANAEVDVVMSNCVINLSPDKARVFQEVYRVLKPGGRVVVSDIIATAEIPLELKNDPALMVRCMSGAILASEIQEMLMRAGFQSILIQPKEESKNFIKDWAPGSRVEDYVVSATIKAVKPS